MNLKEWMKKVDENLRQNSEDALKAFQVQREPDIQELARLSGEIEKLEQKKKDAQGTRGKSAKDFIPNNKTLGECERTIFECDHKMTKIQKQIDLLFLKLTDIGCVRGIYPILKLLDYGKES